MKRIIYSVKLKTVILFVLFFCFAQVTTAGNKNKVTVEINSNDKNPLLKIETNWEEGLTALEALQFVAEVKTHPAAKYVFVAAINGVEGEPNKGVWYYEINGQPAKKIAINQPLQKGDVVTWIFKQDVCSIGVKKQDRSK